LPLAAQQHLMAEAPLRGDRVTASLGHKEKPI
jgi:hypothetical protein